MASVSSIAQTIPIRLLERPGYLSWPFSDSFVRESSNCMALFGWSSWAQHQRTYTAPQSLHTGSQTRIEPRIAKMHSARELAAEAELSIITDSYRCQYTNTRCANERAVKRDGDLHKLCEFHRSKANRNQKKLEQKRKLEAKLKREELGNASEASQREAEAPTSFPGCIDLPKDNETAYGLLKDLGDEDLHALATLLDVSDSC
ncbi:hypothetical protein FI667_g12378, partial [Globisporangium splendens]